MDWFSRNQSLLAAIAVMFACVAYLAAFELLLQSLISGSEFVTLVIAATATSLIFVFAPSIHRPSPDQLEGWYAKNRGAGGEVRSVPLQFVEYRKLTEISERLKLRR